MANTKITTNVIADGAITSAKLDTNITISGDITGTLATAAQPNITSLGTLTALTGGTGDLNWDSGTLFVDVSANRVGISTTSPDSKFHTYQSAANYVAHFESANANSYGVWVEAGASANNGYPLLQVTSNAGSDTYLRVDSGTGHCGIGTSSPSNKLVIAEGTNQHGIEFAPGTLSYIQAYDRATSDYGDLKIDAQTIRFGTDNGTERIRIDTSGNVGIGTDSPSAKIHLKTTGSEAINIGIQNSQRYWKIETVSEKLSISDVSAGGLARMTFDTSGRVGIGTSSPQTSTKGLHVVHDATEGTPSFPAGEVIIAQRNFNASQGADIAIISGSQSGSSINFGDKDNSQAGRIQYDNNNNAFRFFTNGSNERMRIASNGRTSIGTTTANAGLTVANGDIRTTAAAIANDANSFSMSQEPSGGTLCARGPNGSTRGTIQLSVNADDGGNGIVALKVENNAHITLNDVTRLQQGAAANKGTSGGVGGFELNIDSNAPRMNWYNDNGTSASVQYFYYEGAERGSISVRSGSTAYLTSSDYRLKENVAYTWDATTRLKQLKPARFNFTNDADTIVDGFLAHEVSSIVPDAISGTKDEVDSDGNPKYQGIDQSKLVPLLTKAIQEQQIIIDDLKSRIETLEG